MIRRLYHIVGSLWLVATSLAPGQGWALCFEASGRVAVEWTAFSGASTTAGTSVTSCAEDCPPERCNDCRDVSLGVADRACPRRDATSVVLTVLPIRIELPIQPMRASVLGAMHARTTPADASPHLIRVLRC